MFTNLLGICVFFFFFVVDTYNQSWAIISDYTRWISAIFDSFFSTYTVGLFIISPTNKKKGGGDYCIIIYINKSGLNTVHVILLIKVLIYYYIILILYIINLHTYTLSRRRSVLDKKIQSH